MPGRGCFKLRAMRTLYSVFTVCLGLGVCVLGAACERSPDPAQDFSGDGLLLAEKGAAMHGFSWVVDKQVAGMPRPGSARPLDQDLIFLQEQGIDVLVSLTETPVNPAALGTYGIEPMHLPVQDFHPPTQEQLDTYVEAVQKWMAEGRQVGTHCGAGMGRTGTFLAALFVMRGFDADGAIAEIRRLRPGSIETKAQEDAVREFAARHQK